MRALTLVLALALIGAAIAESGPAQKKSARPTAATRAEEARAHIDSAGAAYRAGHFVEAINEYERAYAEWDNPSILKKLAKAHEAAGHNLEAARLWRLWQQRDGLNAMDHAAAIDERVASLDATTVFPTPIPNRIIPAGTPGANPPPGPIIKIAAAPAPVTAQPAAPAATAAQAPAKPAAKPAAKRAPKPVAAKKKAVADDEFEAPAPEQTHDQVMAEAKRELASAKKQLAAIKSRLFKLRHGPKGIYRWQWDHGPAPEHLAHEDEY